MSDQNTLFILSKWGLKVAEKNKGLFESHMWILDNHECSMKYLSLHKSKSERAYRGGEILEIRNATDEEIKNHQSTLNSNGIALMANTANRKVLMFRWDKSWRELWPKEAKSNPMAYKGLGFVNKPKPQ